MSENYNLSSLEIKNFRQYKDVTIKFSQQPDKAFTIIRGANGAGKTNVMNAITWCLYGEEQHLGDDEKGGLPQINTQVLKEAEKGKLIRMSVVLTLADNDGDRFKISRELSLYNIGNNDDMINDPVEGVTIPRGSVPTVKKAFFRYDQGRGGWESTDYFDKSVKEILPEELANYFLFDGEKLEDFFDQESEDTKYGIESVSQISIVYDAYETLNKVIKQKKKNIKNLDPKTLEYQQIVDTENDMLKQLETRKKNLVDQLKTKRKRKHDIENVLIKSGGDVGEWQKSAKQAEDEKEQFKKKRNELENELHDHVLKHLPYAEMLAPMRDTLDHIKEKAKEGILPPKIEDIFVKQLLNSGECICGNDISEGNPSRVKISRMLEKAQYSQINGICMELQYELESLLNTDTAISELDNMQKEIVIYKGLEKKKHDEHQELKARIGNVDDKKIGKYSDEKQQLEEDIERMDRDHGALELQITNQKNKCDKAERDHESEIRKDAKHSGLSNQLKFCHNAADGLDRVANELLADVRNQVQQHTKEYFLKFIWKKNTYDDVKINEDYRISVHHMDGYNVRASLSKGEKLILALSFMAALRKITGFRFPLIIDTPLGRVSGAPKHNIARLLPDFLKNTQVTLLVTDSEYQSQITDDDDRQTFPPVRDVIGQYVGNDYNINYIDTDKQSSVVPNN